MATTSIWIVKAEFENRDDAIALVDLAQELGISVRLSAHCVNSRAKPMRETRAGKAVLRSMELGRSYDYEHFFIAMQEAGYDATTAGPTLSRLTSEGDLRRVSVGIYQLADKKE